MLSRNRKSIAVGATLFVVGQLIAAVLVAKAGNSSGGGILANGGWLLVQLSSYIGAALAGAVAARLAVDRPIGIGVLAVLVGTSMFLVPAIATGRQDITSAILAPLMFAFFAWLGALLGAYTRTRSGT